MYIIPKTCDIRIPPSLHWSIPVNARLLGEFELKRLVLRLPVEKSPRVQGREGGREGGRGVNIPVVALLLEGERDPDFPNHVFLHPKL